GEIGISELERRKFPALQAVARLGDREGGERSHGWPSPKAEARLLHHLRDYEEMVFGGGSVLDDIGGIVAVGHLILALPHLHGNYRRHRLDMRDIDFVQLLDPVEDRGEFACKTRDIAFLNLDARKMRDAFHRR